MIDSSFKFAGIAGAMALAISASVVAQDAVQWRVEDGGNGHWYEVLLSSVPCNGQISADEIVLAAEATGGHLVSFTSEAEWQFVVDAIGRDPSEGACISDWFIGLRSDPGSNTWEWSTGEPVRFTAWGSADCGAGPYPNSSPSSTLAYASHRQDCGIVWDDGVVGSVSRNYAVEWSADCNGDGIVDYGQIRDGTFADNNANGVPDCCDAGTACDLCLGDITGNGVVDAADLGILLAVWNTDGKSNPEADINGDGTVNAADLGILLGAWGPCP